MGEAKGPSLLFEHGKLAGIVEARNRQVFSRRLKILTDGHNVAADGSEVAHDFAGLVHGFSHSEDQPGLGAHAQLLRLAEYLDRSLILSLWPDCRKEPPDGFDVVIQNLRSLGANHREGCLIPFEIRNQNFNRAAWTELSGLPNCFSKDPGAAIAQFIPVHRCDHGMSKAQRLDRFCDATRFFVVDRRRPACLDCTVVASPGADVAQDEERRGARVPTFPSIRTASFFADGMELEPVHRLLDVEVVRTGFRVDFEPGGEAL